MEPVKGHVSDANGGSLLRRMGVRDGVKGCSQVMKDEEPVTHVHLKPRFLLHCFYDRTASLESEGDYFLPSFVGKDMQLISQPLRKFSLGMKD